jgi:hypothetical protein
MAKINISVDTETQEISVDVDGKSFENATDINIYKYRDYYEGEDEVSVNITSRSKEDNGVNTTTTICAHNADKTSKAERDIEKMFMGRIR